MIDAAAESKDELTAKLAVKRLLDGLQTVEDETELTEQLRLLSGQSQWCESARELVTDWWRGYVRLQPVPRLHRLDKLMDGKRGLEIERGILHTLMAVRKMLGQWSLHEFASGYSLPSAYWRRWPNCSIPCVPQQPL